MVNSGNRGKQLLTFSGILTKIWIFSVKSFKITLYTSNLYKWICMQAPIKDKKNPKSLSLHSILQFCSSDPSWQCSIPSQIFPISIQLISPPTHLNSTLGSQVLQKSGSSSWPSEQSWTRSQILRVSRHCLRKIAKIEI